MFSLIFSMHLLRCPYPNFQPIEPIDLFFLVIHVFSSYPSTVHLYNRHKSAGTEATLSEEK